MKPGLDQVQSQLRRLAGEIVSAEAPARMEARRARVVAELSAVLRKESSRKKRRHVTRLWGAGACLAAAAAIAVLVGRGTLQGPGVPEDNGIGTVAAVTGSVTMTRDGLAMTPTGASESKLMAEDLLGVGSGGLARISFSRGPVVDLSSDTVVRVGSRTDDAAMEVRSGHVDVQVPKLPRGQSFAVRAQDATVVVHGTRFSVDVSTESPNHLPATIVRVSEGSVAVHRAGTLVAMLDAGGSWSTLSSGPASASAQLPAADPSVACAQAPSSSAGRAVAAGETRGAPQSLAGRLPSETPESSLMEENRLFRAAVEAERRGRDDEALGHLDTLLRKHPQSTLGQQARVERIRCLTRMGRGKAAATEARRYLAEHPDGFARDEARSVVLQPQTPDR